MAIHVKLSTSLRDYVPEYRPADGLWVEAGPAVTAKTLAGQVGLPLEAIKIIMVNGAHAEFETLIKDGDRVGYFPAVGGG